MAYFDQAQLSQDYDFQQRIAACAAVERPDEDPQTWAGAHQWRIAAAPGFADKYASALAGGVERPGADASVIADGEILAAVQATP
jgi:hypothetical protein